MSAVAKISAKGGDKQGRKRDRSTVKRLKMYNTRPVRNRKGKIVSEQFKSKDVSHSARIEPNRKWFGPVRTVTQTELTTFREALKDQQAQPNMYLMRASKVPYSLLRDSNKEAKVNLLEVESFEATFGKKRTRKRPRLNTYSIESLVESVEQQGQEYKQEADHNLVSMEDTGEKDKARDALFSKGQSHRIWNELYKVIDSSDVVIQVLDARDPEGTRCKHIEKYLKEKCPHKHLVLVLNKCDLVPVWSTKRWLFTLAKEYPVVAVHASVTKPFGKGTLIQLLRQFQNIHSDKQQISIGFVGYPNVGKSSIINMLRSKKVCKVAPIPGETKVWQYITLFKKIFLIDCPGVVTPAKDESEDNIVLKGVVRVENLEDPTLYVPALLDRVKLEHVQKTYGIMEWEDPTDFLEQMAFKTGKLHKKGEPDTETVAKMILNDWIRGKLPFFIPPPDTDEYLEKKEDEEEERKGKEEGAIATVPTREEAILAKKSGKKPVAEGLRKAPKKKEIIQPTQQLSGLRVRDEFKVKRANENNDDNEEKSNVSESEEEEEEEEEEEGQNVESEGGDGELEEVDMEEVEENLKRFWG